MRPQKDDDMEPDVGNGLLRIGDAADLGNLRLIVAGEAIENITYVRPAATDDAGDGEQADDKPVPDGEQKWNHR